MKATKKSPPDDEEDAKIANSRSNRDVSERKHGCDVCKRRFFTRKDVKRHQVVHTGSRQFVCCLCRHAFGRKDHLVRHEKKVHPQQLAKGVLTPVLLNDQLMSFGILVPVTRQITSALNSNQQLLGNAALAPLLSVAHPPTCNDDAPMTDPSEAPPPSPTLDFESLTLTLTDWTALCDVDVVASKTESESLEGDATPPPPPPPPPSEEPSSTPSPGGYDSSVSEYTTSPGSSAGSSHLGDPNDFLNGIDLVEDLNLHEIDLDTMTELYPLETEDYFTCL